MSTDPDSTPRLAPLQRVMLRDTLAGGAAGHHVEQVEMVLAPGLTAERVAAAWSATVARTEALRIAFLTNIGIPVGWEFVEPGNVLDLGRAVPSSWESWLEIDRRRPLLVPREVPWRAVYWHGARRFIWTFHHALLDGRSIARVLRGFLERLDSGEPGDLAISDWSEPSPEMVALAGKMFLDLPEIPTPAVAGFPPGPDGLAVRCLGLDATMRLESRAAALEVTAATILTWAWGQALAEALGIGAVLVEQVRAGAPRPRSAGFTMNTLPVAICLAGGDGVENNLRDLRARLLALREIESVSPDNFPPGGHPNLDGPWSSVIMVERGTLHHAVGASDLMESLVLHEAKGETLMATAYLLPDLRLEVEGPGRHHLLDAWIEALSAPFIPPLRTSSPRAPA
jgi:hypothetical protein